MVCVGRNEYEAVRQRYPLKNVFYLPNGVDVGRFASADGEAFRRTYEIGPDEKIVLCVARIDPQKDQMTLLKAFYEAAGTRPEYRLVFLGPVSVDSYRVELELEIERLGLHERVLLLAGMAPDDPLLPAAYRAADLFVLPSMHEPFGIVVLEAWAAGVPVIASRTGGIPGFAVDRENALLFEPGCHEKLARILIELMDDSALRSSLSTTAFKAVSENYDWGRAAGRLLEIYEKMMGK